MSSTSSIETSTSLFNCLEGTFIIIKEKLAIFPTSQYLKISDIVKIYLKRNEKTPEDFFNCLNNEISTNSRHYILLGFSLAYGIGTTPDSKKAFLEFEKAANTDDSFGQLFLGHCYIHGIGTLQDLGKAFELYSKATEAGNLSAQVNLGLCYETGLGIVTNQKKAFELYSEAEKKGNLYAQNCLGVCYENALGIAENLKKAFKLYSRAANAGNSDAQINLACCYENGWGTTRNLEKAIEFYSKAAEEKNSHAQNHLGWCFENGWGTTRNLEKAFEFYSKAAEEGNSYAQNHLGWCYENGWGTTRNVEKAFKFYSAAAEAGNSNGQYNLGIYYEKGWGTTSNLEKAFKLYSKAAEAGNSNAQYNLGNCYINGFGITKNPVKAFELYSKAAEAGNSDAKYNLGLFYMNGLGATKDREKPFNLSPEATGRGNSEARNNRELYYKNEWGTTKNSRNSCKIFLKPTEAGSLIPQTNLGTYRRNRFETIKDLEKVRNPNGWGTAKFLENSFKSHSTAAEAGNLNAQYNLGWCYQNGCGTTKNLEKALELYLKVTEANNSSYPNDFPDLNAHDLISNFEAFFDQLSDEFKCLKCGNLLIIIIGSPICTFCDTDKCDKIIYRASLPKCPECYRILKDPIWCKDCECSRLSKILGTWTSGNNNIDKYIRYTQTISESCRECLEWISPDQIEFLDKVGEGGFGVVKKGSWKRGKILFWDENNQKHERSGVTKVAFKCLKDSQNINNINSSEFVAHLKCASSQHILECYGITKDIRTNEYVMVLPFAEHGDLRAFLEVNETTLTWSMFLRILLQIASGLRFIHGSKLVHGDLHPGNILVLKTDPLKVVISDLGLCRPADYDLQSGKIYGVLEYLAPEICKGSYHTKYSDIYSFAIISCEIISGETFE
ncbi:hypothetical protein G9A89_009367 [Geosiphon pyriformis]|nr:hypothetical protein G9A89_009367 [Geosiphon pyriformis]